MNNCDNIGKVAARTTQLAALGISTIGAGFFGYMNANSLPVNQGAFAKATIETIIESAVAYTGINAVMRAASKSGASDRAFGFLSGGAYGAGKAAICVAISYGIGYGFGLLTK